MVDSIFETMPANAKQSYCQFLGASIAYLSHNNPDRWGVTLTKDKDIVRLNAGWVESLVLHQKGLRVLLDRKTAPPRLNFDGHRYRYAPGCETAAIPLPELSRFLPKLTKSHHNALSAAASSRPSPGNILGGHSIGVTKWLSQVLGREVPNPVRRSRPLHIVQGGIQNGDKELLERLARGSRRTRSWIIPQSAVPGDDVVIYIRGFGFFAVARVGSQTERRADWKNRYSAGLHSIALVTPPVSLAAIRRHIPELEWAKYPRSITTPSREVAGRIRALITSRMKGDIDLDEDFQAQANIYELRKIAILKSSPSLPAKRRKMIYRARSSAIHKYVLARAKGRCEGCMAAAPFNDADGQPFLETHHTMRVADEGPDHPSKVAGLCPNCHKRAHFAEDAQSFNRSLIKKLRKLESAASRF